MYHCGLNQNYMHTKKVKSTFILVLGSFLFATVAMTGCNNSGESNETKKDSVSPAKMDAPKKDSMTAPAKDTTKMDTSVKVTAKPVHTP